MILNIIMPKFSLKYFILNSNTLKLYREIYKYTGKVKDSFTKLELREYIKSEFRRECSKEYNESVAEYKLGLTRKKINELKNQIDQSQ